MNATASSHAQTPDGPALNHADQPRIGRERDDHQCQRRDRATRTDSGIQRLSRMEEDVDRIAGKSRS